MPLTFVVVVANGGRSLSRECVEQITNERPQLLFEPTAETTWTNARRSVLVRAWEAPEPAFGLDTQWSDSEGFTAFSGHLWSQRERWAPGTWPKNLASRCRVTSPPTMIEELAGIFRVGAPRSGRPRLGRHRRAQSEHALRRHGRRLGRVLPTRRRRRLGGHATGASTSTRSNRLRVGSRTLPISSGTEPASPVFASSRSGSTSRCHRITVLVGASGRRNRGRTWPKRAATRQSTRSSTRYERTSRSASASSPSYLRPS